MHSAHKLSNQALLMNCTLNVISFVFEFKFEFEFDKFVSHIKDGLNTYTCHTAYALCVRIFWPAAINGFGYWS